MTITAEELQRDLAGVLNRVIAGKPVRVTHQGRVFTIVLPDPPGKNTAPLKMDRLIRRSLVVGTPAELEAEAGKMLEEFERLWSDEFRDRTAGVSATSRVRV